MGFIFVFIMVLFGEVILLAENRTRFYLKDNSIMVGDIVEENKNKHKVILEPGKRKYIYI